jgi:ribosome-associated translation inhibitor RaiA
LGLGGYAKTNDTGDIASGDTINVALSKLENKAAAVTILDKDGSVVVNPTTAGTEVSVHIKSGEHVIANDASSGGVYTDLDLVKITTGLPETIKERYQFLATDDSQIGVNIDVPKDSHIVSINYITTGEHAQNLEYVYVDVSGNTKTTYIDMSELVLETEFASGVTVTDHIAHGVVDPTSESFLTVGADGFKVSGVSGLVTSAIEALDVTGDTAAAGQYVAAIEETDGIVAVKTRANVSEAVLNNYSKGSDSGAVASTDTVNQAISKLENQVDAAKAAATTQVEKDSNASHLTLTSATDASGATIYTIGESDIASKSDLDTLSGKAVTAAAMTGGSATITAATDGTKQIEINVDGSTISATTYQKGSDASAVVATDTINEAISKLENQVDKAKAAATTVVTAGTSADTTAHLEISASTDSTTSATTYTVDLKDIASASALTDEITARKAVDGQTGDTYEANTAATYISGATSLNNADVLLNAAIANVDTNMLSGVTGSNAISASTKSDKGQTISLILDDSTTSIDATAQYASNSGNALQITNDGLYLDSTWDCGFYSSPANP